MGFALHALRWGFLAARLPPSRQSSGDYERHPQKHDRQDRTHHLAGCHVKPGIDGRLEPLHALLSMLEVMRQDYVRTARAKGLLQRAVIYKHALRNALVPIITIVVFQISRFVSAAQP